MNPREWEAFAGFFADHGLISSAPGGSSCSPTSCFRDPGVAPTPAARRAGGGHAAGATAGPGPRPRASGEREASGEAAKRRVGREVLLDLLDGRPAAEPGEPPTSFT